MLCNHVGRHPRLGHPVHDNGIKQGLYRFLPTLAKQPRQTADMHTVSSPFSLPVPPLQLAVDRFVRSLGGPHELLGLRPRKKGNSGRAAALNPAIVLGCISAFEGFAEEFIALGLASEGATFGHIAKEVGSWNNPDLREFGKRATKLFGPSGATVTGGVVRINVNTVAGHSTWAERPLAWADVLDHGTAWMQVRHALTHGLVPSWSDSVWPKPLSRSPDARPASDVLRKTKAGRHSLVLQNAVNCARVYTVGARYVADAAAGWLGESLDWSSLPEFK